MITNEIKEMIGKCFNIENPLENIYASGQNTVLTIDKKGIRYQWCFVPSRNTFVGDFWEINGREINNQWKVKQNMLDMESVLSGLFITMASLINKSNEIKKQTIQKKNEIAANEIVAIWYASSVVRKEISQYIESNQKMNGIHYITKMGYGLSEAKAGYEKIQEEYNQE